MDIFIYSFKKEKEKKKKRCYIIQCEPCDWCTTLSQLQSFHSERHGWKQIQQAKMNEKHWQDSEYLFFLFFFFGGGVITFWKIKTPSYFLQ